MARLRCLFRIRFAVARSSMASWLWVLANWLETRCRKCWRMLAMRAYSRTSRLTALARLREPRLARETACARRCIRLSRRASGRGGVESGNLAAIGGGGHGEGSNASIDPDKVLTATYRGRVVAALCMEVGCFYIEADHPAITVPSDRCEQESSAR